MEQLSVTSGDCPHLVDGTLSAYLELSLRLGYLEFGFGKFRAFAGRAVLAPRFVNEPVSEDLVAGSCEVPVEHCGTLSQKM